MVSLRYDNLSLRILKCIDVTFHLSTLFNSFICLTRYPISFALYPSIKLYHLIFFYFQNNTFSGQTFYPQSKYINIIITPNFLDRPISAPEPALALCPSAQGRFCLQQPQVICCMPNINAQQ